MAKTVELRRHHPADGDVLTDEGVRTALEVGACLPSTYEIFISSGAQRSTQTLACYLAGSGQRVTKGVVADDRFRSKIEDRWRDAYESAGAGDIESLRRADPDLVASESRTFGDALKDVFTILSADGRALVVGHSPMQEATVYGLTGEIVEPLAKGAGVRVVLDKGRYRVEPLDPES